MSSAAPFAPASFSTGATPTRKTVGGGAPGDSNEDAAGGADLFNRLFNLGDLQKLQDQFAQATGAASMVVRHNGTAITRPSNFARFFAEGSCRCTPEPCESSRIAALPGILDDPAEVVVQKCLGGGLWYAEAALVVGGRHVANWIVCQVRDEELDEVHVREHARKIGADESAFMQAYRQLPAMSHERFQAVAQLLFTLARQLSEAAYQNVKQARSLAQRDWAERALRASENQFRDTIEHAGAGYFRLDRQGCFEAVNREWLQMHGFTSVAQILGQPFNTTQIEQDRAEAEILLQKALAGHELPNGEFTRRRADGSVGHHTFSLHPVRRAGEVVAVEGFLIDTSLLRRAKATYQMLFEKMLDGFAVHDIICDADGKPVDCYFVTVNPAFERQTGLKAKDILGRTVLEVLPEIEKIWIERFGQVALTGRPTMFEDYSRPLGRHFSVSAFSPSLGQVACVIVDITARKLAEIELGKLSRAVEQSPAMVLITNLNGAIEYINPIFTTKTGYSLDEVRGRNPRLLNSGETPPGVYQKLWATIRAGREWRGELRNRKKTGELFWEASTICPIFAEGGQITHYLAVKEDITERKRAEARIREQAALLDVAQDAIIVTHLDRALTYWNRQAALMYEIPDNAAGRLIEEVIYQEMPLGYEEDWTTVLARGEREYVRRQVTRAGRLIDVRVRAKVFTGASGDASSVLLVYTDITESKRIEEQFLRAQRLEILGGLASGVAHDLNNVLTPILMAVEILRPLAQAPEDQATVQLLSDCVRRGSDIVQQLLLFGRGSDSPRAPLDVGDTLNEVGRMMQGTFPKNIVLSIQAPADLWPVEADGTQIHQVVLNLCVNSRDAMPLGGRLYLLAENVQVDEALARSHGGERTGPHVRIKVKDTGGGIPPEHIEKIFDPFFTTKPIGEGTGLGLATVLGIVRSHGGIVAVKTGVNEGTTFEVYLPAATVAGGQGAVGLEKKDTMGRDELILVVDDDEGTRSVLQRALSERNYRVLIAFDGAEALGVFMRNAANVKLVITNVRMPVLDGAQTIRVLRKMNPQLTVIAMSGLASHRSEFEKNFGPHLWFLPKPFESDYALGMVREALDATPVGIPKTTAS